MPAAYSRDLRERLLQANDAGRSAAEIARALGVSARTLTRYRALLRQGASLEPKPIPGRPRSLDPDQEALLVAQVADCPDATLAEHRDRLAQEHGLSVSVWTVGRSLRRHGLPLKKSR
jgi:transposase